MFIYDLNVLQFYELKGLFYVLLRITQHRSMLGFRSWGKLGDLGFSTNHIVINFLSYSSYSSLDFRRDNQHHLRIHKAYTHRHLVIRSSRILYSAFRKRVTVVFNLLQSVIEVSISYVLDDTP
jgi:hypothetical protein